MSEVPVSGMCLFSKHICIVHWQIQVWADRAAAPPPPQTKNRGFLLFKNLTFCPFCMKIDEKLSASGGLRGASPLTIHQDHPWIPLEALPLDPRYMLALHALGMVRPPFRKSWIHPWYSAI